MCKEDTFMFVFKTRVTNFNILSRTKMFGGGGRFSPFGQILFIVMQFLAKILSNNRFSLKLVGGVGGGG